MNLSPALSASAPGTDCILIPAGSFFCPYWMLDLAIILIFWLGLIIGFGSAFGWKQLYFRIMTKIFC
jgi:hypothetical protein